MKYLSFFIAFAMLACNVPCVDSELNTARRDFSGNSIRLDGIYHNKKNNQFFLYKNGIYQSGCFDRNITAIPDRFECSKTVPSSTKKDRGTWRIFIVKSDTIYMEGWGLISDCQYDVFSYTGKILNDTTLVVPTDRAGLVRDTFYFAKFFPKPDSTNDLIK